MFYIMADYRIRCTSTKPWPACQNNVRTINRNANTGNIFVIPNINQTLTLEKNLVNRATTFLIDGNALPSGANIVLPSNPDEGQMFVVTSIGTAGAWTITGRFMGIDGAIVSTLNPSNETLRYIATFKPITIPGTTPTVNTIYPVWLQI